MSCTVSSGLPKVVSVVASAASGPASTAATANAATAAVRRASAAPFLAAPFIGPLLAERRSLLHIRDTDDNPRIGEEVAVARPHRQLERTRARLEVLARAHIEQLAAGGVDLEQARGVAALEAVAERRAVRVRRRDSAERHPVRTAIAVLRQVEGVALLAERRNLLHVGDADDNTRIGEEVAVACSHRELERTGAGLEVLPRARVEQLAAGGIDLEQSRGIATLEAVAERRALGVRRRDRADRHPIGAAVGVLRQRECNSPACRRLGAAGLLAAALRVVRSLPPPTCRCRYR